MFLNIPTNTRGNLAESWSQPDPLTYIIKVRQGVHWHDKPPMSGRELDAYDVEYNYHRLLGLGSGFTEPAEQGTEFKSFGVQFESIEATDKYTVVFKLKELNLAALFQILDSSKTFILPPEVIKEHGGITDWRNLVGTGPFMLTDYVEGSSMTWDKNPDYWGYDEKYPENRLPYIDQLRALIMPEVATYMAALRAGKVDYIGPIAVTQLRTPDQVESLQRTNPEIEIWPFALRSDNAFGMNVQVAPFDDIRVRKAMQMAIDLETINNAYWKGYADIVPQGQLHRSFTEVVTPFEEWPEEVKKGFAYDPEGAEALLDEAGYPRGADGIRFKTECMFSPRYPLDYAELIVSYWADIGIDVEIDVAQGATIWPRWVARDFEITFTESAKIGPPLGWQERYTTGTGWNTSNASDPVYDGMYEAAAAATTLEEQYRLIRETQQYAIEKFWTIWGGMGPQFSAVQPWVKGFNGEIRMGNTGQDPRILTRLWIDQELKEAMGH